ncbi:hypothetical protein [Streptomyces bobili]|uniref:hypothetical protein n=1 Tax=Streptomyces bobili TaxID=67280 RepID=UPI00382F5507
MAVAAGSWARVPARTLLAVDAYPQIGSPKTIRPDGAGGRWALTGPVAGVFDAARARAVMSGAA